MIISTHNSKIRTLCKLQKQSEFRRKMGLYVIEGIHLVDEMLVAGVRPEFVLYDASIELQAPKTLAQLHEIGITPILASKDVLQHASATQTPQGLLAVLPITPLPIPKKPTLVLVLDEIRDPGNLGTILRSAAAANVDMLLLSPGCVDPYNPKVVRAAMGAHFRIPIAIQDWLNIHQNVRGLQLYLANTHASSSYTQVDFRSPCAIFIGNESRGAGSKTYALSPISIYIPMPGGSESLNAGVAASILIFEAIRQRETQS